MKKKVLARGTLPVDLVKGLYETLEAKYTCGNEHWWLTANDGKTLSCIGSNRELLKDLDLGRDPGLIEPGHAYLKLIATKKARRKCMTHFFCGFLNGISVLHYEKQRQEHAEMEEHLKTCKVPNCEDCAAFDTELKADRAADSLMKGVDDRVKKDMNKEGKKPANMALKGKKEVGKKKGGKAKKS